MSRPDSDAEEMGVSGRRSVDDNSRERIADPENYNLSRRLKQLHDAKEWVINTKRWAQERYISNSERDKRFEERERDMYIVEAVLDYIQELLPILERQELKSDFLEETIRYDISATDSGGMKVVDQNQSKSGEMSLDTLLESRGHLGSNGDSQPIPYRASMEVWSICNRYFEQIAGAKFERDSLPTDSGFDSTDDERGW